jgi:uncharacterized membrane protein YphA (DoxX/SURF4 family)
MDIFLEYKADAATLLARIILGILFFFQGYDKLFGIGLKQTEAGMDEAFRQTHLPKRAVHFITIFSSSIELIGGMLLIAGWLIYPALIVLAFDLVIVVFGMSLRQPLWDMRYVWPRLALVLLLLLLPAAWDRISVDYFIRTYGNSPLISAH